MDAQRREQADDGLWMLSRDLGQISHCGDRTLRETIQASAGPDQLSLSYESRESDSR